MRSVSKIPLALVRSSNISTCRRSTRTSRRPPPRVHVLVVSVVGRTPDRDCASRHWGSQVDGRNTRQCALPGCEIWVEDIPGRPQRRYCSPAHRNAARQARRAATRDNRMAAGAAPTGRHAAAEGTTTWPYGPPVAETPSEPHATPSGTRASWPWTARAAEVPSEPDGGEVPSEPDGG